MLRPLNSQIKKALLEATAAFTAALPGSPGETYLESRGVGPRTATAHQLGYVDRATAPEAFQEYHGRIAIPYVNAKRDVVWIKFRATPENGPDADKYAQQAGGGTRLFNTQALSAPGDLLALVEGEMDTVTMTGLGIPTVGIPGAQNWQEHHHRCLQGWGRVVMFYDRDKPGRELVKLIKKKMPDIIPLAAPAGHHDVNEAFVAGLGDAIVALARGEEVQDHDAEDDGFNGITNPDGEIPY